MASFARLRIGLLSVTCAALLIASVSSAADHSARSIPPGDNPRERFLNLIDRPRVPLNSSEQAAVVEGGLQQIRFRFNAEAGQTVPGLLVGPVKSVERIPTVIVLHGTGGSKQAMLPLLNKIAALGAIGVSIDARFAGERSGGTKGTEAYRAAILETWHTGRGFPFFYDTVWDVMRLVDYLKTRPDVDPTRIGAIGFSKGGVELYLAAAADDRLAAVVPCIGVQSFGWALEHNAWQSRVSTIQSAVDAASREANGSSVDASFIACFYDRVVPGIHREFDGQVMLPQIAPRPLLVINGDHDDRTPLTGLERCIEAAQGAYQQAGALQKFTFLLQPNTAHAVTPDSERIALNWLMEKLSPLSAN